MTMVARDNSPRLRMGGASQPAIAQTGNRSYEN
jgi:hypothetical protein